MSDREQMLAMQLMLKGAVSEMSAHDQKKIQSMVDGISTICQLYPELSNVALGLVSCEKALEPDIKESK